ncbi:gliding motility-associated lipoprotein [Prolixibacteraceae bacterium JC049]|nr:gliding motility-associated lipoprotein [Prolixibacteraceae bacterium JC049]
MNKLRTILIALVFVLAVSACKKNGDAVREPQKRYWFEPTPYGMVYVPQGSFIMGATVDDPATQASTARNVSVGAFWMDETEITNNEYREFTNWVRDSIARVMLGEQFPEFLITDEITGESAINWEEEIEWSNQDYQSALEDLYLPENDRFFGKRKINAHKLKYEYQRINLRQAARRANAYDYKNQRYNGSIMQNGQVVPIQDRSAFIIRNSTAVYPDTLCWIRDFTYTYNEPLALSYNWHPAYSQYPVVGVTWKQAKAFAHWRTQKKNQFQALIKEASILDYRLPNEAEWEYAARGGLQNADFPWGAYYSRSCEGCFLANFKPMRGDYVSDNKYGVTTVPVAKYDPNQYGLYDMAGNVAEWTTSAYDEASYNIVSDMNPNYEYDAQPDDPAVLKRKVIRGGSWKDISHYLKVTTRDYEYQDSAKSFIGFRCVRPSFGNKLEY